MRAGGRALCVGLVLLALPGIAGPLKQSLRPEARPTETTAPLGAARGDRITDLVAGVVADTVLATVSTSGTVSPANTDSNAHEAELIHTRPKARPLSAQELAFAARPTGTPSLGPEESLLPMARPQGFLDRLNARKKAQIRGSVCGNPEIQGEVVGRVPGRIKGCGIEDAVRVRSVAGVKLSQPALINCDTARALNAWVERGAKPAFRRRGPLVELKVAASYSCRTRNNQPGAKLSEHSRGNAIDISGFTMMDGEVVTVKGGWGQGTTLRPLSRALKAACGPFGTVLGPESDRYHGDHFHMDVARYRSGPYCR